MTWASLLPAGAFLLAAAGVWLEALHLAGARTPGVVPEAPRRWARRAQVGSVLALSGAFLWLALAFLRGDLGVAYVWSHTHLDLPWMYRLAGTWAGQEGTTLLWATLLAAGLTHVMHREDVPEALAGPTHLVLGSVVALLALFLVLQDPFAPTAASNLADPSTARGLGLNDLLITPLMVVHPPVQFVAYALAALPAGLGLAHLARGPRGGSTWLVPARELARWAFLAASTGLALGALWAYYVLSFGGYWAWDPVETVNLLPWLGLIAFMHVAREPRDAPALATPLLASLGLVLPLFSTVTVRSGLWVSVHAFTDPTSTFLQDPALRLLRILEVHAPTRFFLGLLLFLTFLTVALALRAHGPHLATTTPRLRALQGLVGFHAGLAVLGLVAPRVLLGFLFEAGAFLAGAPGLGLGVLLAVLAGAPLLALYVGDAPSSSPPDGVITWRRLPKVAAVTVTLGLAVVLLLLVRTVNGGALPLMLQRVPLLIIPATALLAWVLAWHPLGRWPALGLALGSLLLGGVLAILRPAGWVLALGLPVAATTIVAGLLRVRHEVLSPRTGTRRRVLADGLLLLGLLGLIVGASPPSELPAISALVLWPLGLASLLAGAAVHRDGSLPDLPRLRPGLKRFAVHLVHLAVVLGVLGYGVSTYAAHTELLEEVPVPGQASVGDRVVELHQARGEEGRDGRMRAVEVPVTLRGSHGDAEAQGVLRLYWRGPPTDHYDPHLDVRRGLLQDVVLNPLSLRTSEGLVEAHGDHERLLEANVTHATFQVQVRPGMNLLWGGASLGGAGVVLLAWTARGTHRPRDAAGTFE